VFHLAALGRTTSASADVEGRTVEEFETAAVSGNGRFVAFNSRPLDNCMVQRCPDEVNSPQVYVTDRVSGRTELVSRNSLGLPGNAGSIGASLSHDGRYVGFTSAASDLVDSDTNRAPDYFVHDRLTGRTVLATLSSEGEQGTAEGTPYLSLYTVAGHLSADGRYATFHSVLDGLAPGDQRGTYDVFVRDLRTGVTTIETLDGNADHRGDAREPRISANGRYVSFVSPWRFDEARYPRCDDLESCRNVFLRDRLRGTTRLVSVDRTGLADSAVGQHQMSADGSVLAWATTSTLGDPSDTNGVSDVFVVRGSGHPTRVSLSHAGEQQDDRGVGSEFSPADLRHVALSGDGRRVAFDSRAPNLVPGDTNERMDVFVRDLESQTTTRVSTSSTGGEANGDSFRPTVSFDGRVLAFESDAADLAPGDDNRLADVFVHDLSGV
jgi:Tol biopolymer transport system component